MIFRKVSRVGSVPILTSHSLSVLCLGPPRNFLIHSPAMCGCAAASVGHQLVDVPCTGVRLWMYENDI